MHVYGLVLPDRRLSPYLLQQLSAGDHPAGAGGGGSVGVGGASTGGAVSGGFFTLYFHWDIDRRARESFDVYVATFQE